MFPKRVRKTAVTLKQVARVFDQDFNLGQPEYEAEMLPTRPPISRPNVKIISPAKFFSEILQ
jgi:hypothetical protein